MFKSIGVETIKLNIPYMGQLFSECHRCSSYAEH